MGICRIYVGIAGWNLRKEYADQFPTDGSHLQRYAARFNCVEINSSFYRSHRPATYMRWAKSTPPNFRFTVKLPKQITHELRLENADEGIKRFAEEVTALGEKLGVVLVQLPPSLPFDSKVTAAFFRTMRRNLTCSIACEPRHPTWFAKPAGDTMRRHEIGRVAADPSIVPAAADPGELPNHAYFRWHGSPRMYYSAYESERLHSLADRLKNAAKLAKSVWCIFDNTAHGAAIPNAISLMGLLSETAE